MKTIDIRATIIVPDQWEDATDDERYEWLRFSLGLGAVDLNNPLCNEELDVEDFEIDSL